MFKNRTMLQLDSHELLEEALQRSHREPVVFYKHSSSCSLSYHAFEEISKLHLNGDTPVYQVTVQRDRALSNALAERLMVRHESPQVIIVAGGKAVFNTSHFGVKASRIREALDMINFEVE